MPRVRRMGSSNVPRACVGRLGAGRRPCRSRRRTVGSYDGARFVPAGWNRLAFGTAPYATSVFRDRDGRPCMISWLQEDPQHEPGTSGWAGAESLVAELAVDTAGRLTATPHPGLASSTMFANHAPGAWPWAHDLEASAPALATHLTAAADSPAEIQLRRGDQHLVRVTRSPVHDGGHALSVDQAGGFALGRHAQRHDRALAAWDRGQGRAPHPVEAAT
jgi:Glycosyl hydrolases family 32 N-terminal domain